MTKRTNHIGYINDFLHTDVKSYEVFKEDGKMMAVQVEKIPACKPEFVSGGFCAHCTNNWEVWNTQETKEVGEPFQITQNRKGEWGHKGLDIVQGFSCPVENKEYVQDVLDAVEKNPRIGARVYSDEHCTFIDTYLLTKTGKPKMKFYKLGEIEETCRYYYDYNF